ncbi:11054_t:CDS:1 [Funneliformis geosporum]|nr:11054_t:CDS:1 [Funneliformis geosporum]
MVAHNIIRTTDTTIFRTDLALTYKSFGHYASLINKSCKFYEYASYIQDDNYTSEIKCNLHKNDIVMIQVQDFDKSYAIIKAIFKHKGNDKQYYPFIYVDWFEDVHQNCNKLGCPLYSLCHNNT